MKKYLSSIIIISASFAIVLIFTNFCYAQAPTAKPTKASAIDKIKPQPGLNSTDDSSSLSELITTAWRFFNFQI